MVYLISISVIILILLIPIQLKIENKVHKTLIKVRVAYIFTFYIDYSRIVKMFTTSKEDRYFISMRELIENTRKLKSVYPFFERFCKHMTLKEFKLINRFSDEDPILTVTFFSTNAFVSNYIHGLFGKVLKEEYLISNEGEIDVDFLCITHVRLVNTIIVLLEHINKIPLLIKRTT